MKRHSRTRRAEDNRVPSAVDLAHCWIFRGRKAPRLDNTRQASLFHTAPKTTINPATDDPWLFGRARTREHGTKSGRPVGRPKRVFDREEVVRLPQRGMSVSAIALPL